MWMLTKMAWRSLMRNKRRTIITAAVVVFCFALLIMSIGMAEGGHAGMADIGIKMGQSHVYVQRDGYQDAQTLDYLVERPEDVEAAIGAVDPGLVSDVALRLRTDGLVRFGDVSAGVLVTGVLPDVEQRINNLAGPGSRVEKGGGDYLRHPDDVPEKNRPPDIYVGSELARTLDAVVGDYVVLTVQPPGSLDVASERYELRGIFESGVTELDAFWVEVPLPSLQKQLGVGNAVTTVGVIMTDQARVPDVTQALSLALDGRGLEVLDWTTVLAELYAAIVLDDAGMYLTVGIMVLFVALGVLLTILMSVLERTREFGVMMAIGTQPSQIRWQVILEGILLGVMSLAIGLAVGLGINHYLETTGIDWSKMGGEDYQMSGIVFKGALYADLKAKPVAWTALVLFIVIVLSSLFPAIWASRRKPVEALRHV